MIDDPQDTAEQLDEDVIVDDGDIGPMSAEDPTVLLGGADARDDSITRDWREEADIDPDDTRPAERPVTDLLEPGEAGPDQIDDEEELIGEDARPADGVVGPEAAALHIDSDS